MAMERIMSRIMTFEGLDGMDGDLDGDADPDLEVSET